MNTLILLFGSASEKTSDIVCKPITFTHITFQSICMHEIISSTCQNLSFSFTSCQQFSLVYYVPISLVRLTLFYLYIFFSIEFWTLLLKSIPLLPLTGITHFYLIFVPIFVCHFSCSILEKKNWRENCESRRKCWSKQHFKLMKKVNNHERKEWIFAIVELGWLRLKRPIFCGWNATFCGPLYWFVCFYLHAVEFFLTIVSLKIFLKNLTW